MKNKSAVIGVIIMVLVLSLLSGCVGDSEYETAGKTFGSWGKNNPSTWTDTQKSYFNNFMDWADKN